MKTKKIIKQLNKDIDKRIRKADRCGFSVMDLIKTILLLCCILGMALTGLYYCHPVHAQSHIDYYQQQGFTLEQIEEMEQQAKAEWKQTYGDIPHNLTEEQSQYLQKQTALLQGDKH